METPFSLIAAAMLAALAFSPVGPIEYSGYFESGKKTESQEPGSR